MTIDPTCRPIDLPVLRVDCAVWEPDQGTDDSRLTAHLTLGDLSVRLEALAVDRDPDGPPDPPHAYWPNFAQRVRIGQRSYVVVGFQDEMQPALVGAA